MLTRLDILKLEFIYRVIDTHVRKLFLNMYQIKSVIIEDSKKDNLLEYEFASTILDTEILEDLTAFYQTKDTYGNISEKIELTTKDIDYLFEQAEYQMQQK